MDLVVVEMTVIHPFDFFVQEDAEKFPFKYDDVLRKELSRRIWKSCRLTPLLAKLVESAGGKRYPHHRFYRRAKHDDQSAVAATRIRMEPGVQSPEETLCARAADRAAIMRGCWCSCSATWAWRARFVSGYLIQLVADVKSLDGMSGTDRDFTDLHAWAEVYLPGAGWIGLDATSGLLTGEGHIPLACTAEPDLCAPITGAHDKCEAEFSHIDVRETDLRRSACDIALHARAMGRRSSAGPSGG